MIERQQPLPPKYAPGIAAPGPLKAEHQADPRPQRYRPQPEQLQPFKGYDAPYYVMSGVEINQFQGMNSNTNKHILRGQFTAFQYNAMSIVLGQVQVRGGYQQVYWEEF